MWEVCSGDKLANLGHHYLNRDRASIASASEDCAEKIKLPFLFSDQNCRALACLSLREPEMTSSSCGNKSFAAMVSISFLSSQTFISKGKRGNLWIKTRPNTYHIWVYLYMTYLSNIRSYIHLSLSTHPLDGIGPHNAISSEVLQKLWVPDPRRCLKQQPGAAVPDASHTLSCFLPP